MVPSGRHLVAGFTDGTLRLFDLTNKFTHRSIFSNDSFDADDSSRSSSEPLFDSDSSSDEEDHDKLSPSKSTKSRMVCSKSHQRYGTVACQIHAKGVHTSLQMTVAVSPDGLYAFGGVARGSMEMVAVHLANLENHIDVDCTKGLNMLDLLEVQRHADAKLRGFGACTRLQSDASNDTTYILLTGKGIKNIHIWSFVPAKQKWTCLYDTQTNGNSISLLHFRYTPEDNYLQALSKSDQQKVRVWDLSYEQHQGIKESKYYKATSPKKGNPKSRPKRPAYIDLPMTESTLGIGGDFLFGGSYQQISLVNLNMEAPYNTTEIGMPGCESRRVGRQQRGELKSLRQVAGMTMGSSHALFELSDGSIMHYANGAMRQNAIQVLPKTCEGDSNSSTICVARIGNSGVAISALAFSSKIVMHKIGAASSEGYWGFHGIRHSRKCFDHSPLHTDSKVNVDSIVCSRTSSLPNQVANTNTPSLGRHQRRCENTPSPLMARTFTNKCKTKELRHVASQYERSAKVSPENVKTQSSPSTIHGLSKKTAQDLVSILSPEPLTSVKRETSKEVRDRNQSTGKESEAYVTTVPQSENDPKHITNLISPVRVVTMGQSAKRHVSTNNETKTKLKHDSVTRTTKATKITKQKLKGDDRNNSKGMTIHVASSAVQKKNNPKEAIRNIKNSNVLVEPHVALPTSSCKSSKQLKTAQTRTKLTEIHGKTDDSSLPPTKLKEGKKSRTVSPVLGEPKDKRIKVKKKNGDQKQDVANMLQEQKNNLVLHLRIPRNPKLPNESYETELKHNLSGKILSGKEGVSNSVPLAANPKKARVREPSVEKKSKKRKISSVKKTGDKNKINAVCSKTTDITQKGNKNVAVNELKRMKVGLSFLDSLKPRLKTKKPIIEFPPETPKCEQMRINLAMEHRAVHESLRKQVLESVVQLIRSAENVSKSNDELRSTFERSMENYKDILVSNSSVSIPFVSM